MRLRSAILAALLSTLAVITWAQEPDQTSPASLLSVGSRVRLRSTVVQGQPRGLVVALDPSALTLATDSGGPAVKIPLASITALEASFGHKRNTLKGLGIGLVSGALLGLVMPVDRNNCGEYSSNFCSRGEGVSAGTLGGAVIGTIVGALIKSDRWSVITVRPTRTEGAPALGVVVALRF